MNNQETKKRTSIRMDTPMYVKLKQESKHWGMTVNGYVKMLIYRHFKEKGT